MSDEAWDAERADALARTALVYMEKVYPAGAGLEPLEPYHDLVLAAEAAGDLAAYKSALRLWMKAAARVAREARRSQDGDLYTGRTVLGQYRSNVPLG